MAQPAFVEYDDEVMTSCTWCRCKNGKVLAAAQSFVPTAKELVFRGEARIVEILGLMLDAPLDRTVFISFWNKTGFCTHIVSSTSIFT